MIKFPTRITYYQMIIDCTYLLLVLTYSVSITFTKRIQICEIVQKIRRLKQDLELGEVERNIQNER